MGTVQAQAMMSLDGYVAKQDNTIGSLFDWLQNGETAVATPAGDFTMHLDPASAEYWTGWCASLGVLVCGRELFDMAEGWQGRHTLDVPVVVVTHRVPTDWVEAYPEAPFTFVTDGVEAAIARAQIIAGDRVVSVTGGTIARQALELGLLDEVAVNLVPVVMGEGNRPFFGQLSTPEVMLDNPTTYIQGDRVTHLVFPRNALVRTLHHAQRVADLDRSIAFYTLVGYEIVGAVPATELGTLTMLKLYDEKYVSLELVHDPEQGRVEPGGLHHVVVQVEDVHMTVAHLAAHGVPVEKPTSPEGTNHLWTAWLTDPDGYRIELVEWPAGHPAGMTRSDFADPGEPTTSSLPRTPRRVVEELFRRQRAADPLLLDDLVATDMVNHAAGPQGRDGLGAILRNIEVDLGPTTLEEHHLLVEGDLVVHHVTLHGTHRASSMPLLADLPPTGRPARWRFIHVWRVRDGLLVEHWATRDDLGLVEQLRP